MRLTAATFNLRHATRPDEPSWPWQTIPRLRAAVAALDADIVGLQEVDRFVVRSWFADQAGIAARAAHAPEWRFALARRFLGGLYGNVIAVRGAIERHDVIRLSRPAGTEPRVAQIVSVTIRGTALTIVNTHLHNAEPAAALQLNELVDRIADRPRPLVLLGDLNLAPERFAPVLRAAGFDVPGDTPSVPWREPIVQIDVVALAGGSAFDARAPLTPTSDHRPVVATLDL